MASRSKRACASGDVAEVRGQHLDRDLAVELQVAGPVDLAHAAGAEGRDDLEGAESDSGGKTHGSERRLMTG